MYVNSRAILERDGAEGVEVLLQIRDRPDERRPRLELPGGRLEEFEGILDALVREVREETGLNVTEIIDDTHRHVMIDDEVTVECLRPFCVYQTLRGPVDSVGFYFRCHATGALLEKGDGAYGYRWVPVKTLTAQVAAEPDSFNWLTRAALQYYFHIVHA
ncbi:MAG TPA: NUDIX domain-containing protein [Symbiobacteriaceae bacterium]|jgi:8-oxo-dGTP diphosphatase|nr:NUDIX domain-containing protein [Symbiobacteriaceae bacterium]